MIIPSEEKIDLEDLRRKVLERAFSYDLAHSLSEPNTYRHLAGLCLELRGGPWVDISVDARDVGTDSRVVELFQVSVMPVAEAPHVHRWPGGPAIPWEPLPPVNEVLSGRYLESIEFVSQQVVVMPLSEYPKSSLLNERAGVDFQFSGGGSLLAEADEEQPTTLVVRWSRGQTG